MAMIKLNENVVMDELEQGAVLLDTKHEKMVLLQEREHFLLKKSFSCAISDLIEDAIRLFEGDEDEIRNDIVAFFRKLKEEGYIVANDMIL